MHTWERKLSILEREGQRDDKIRNCALKSDWAQLFKIWDLQLYRVDVKEMQIPFRLNSHLDLKCYSCGLAHLRPEIS